ncbi:MAG: glycosyltransferase family 4 protein [Ignavibacteria bacterium]|nr:glycosyltransferase family 4 protein [Ignavibacteria bacterium]
MNPQKKINAAWVISGFYSDENDFGGAAAIHLLAKELSHDPGIHLTVFALYHPHLIKEFRLHNINVLTLNSYPPEKLNRVRKLKAWRLFHRKFAEKNKLEKFDIIHSFWAGEPGYNASIAAKKHNIPFAANICGGELAAFPEIKYGQQLKKTQKYFIDKTMYRADKIVCGCDFIAEKVSDIYGNNIADKTIRLPFGVDTSLFAPKQAKETSNSGGPVLINIAHAVPVKDHKTLLSAIALVKKHCPGILLKVYGNDPEGYVMSTSENMGIGSNVKVFGFVEYIQIPEALKGSDVFVLSSVYESQNMSILEAAFTGLPVVSTNVGVAREISPYISEPGDAIALAENILIALKQKKPVYKELHEKFSLKASAESYKKLYNEMVS